MEVIVDSVNFKIKIVYKKCQRDLNKTDFPLKHTKRDHFLELHQLKRIWLRYKYFALFYSCRCRKKMFIASSTVKIKLKALNETRSCNAIKGKGQSKIYFPEKSRCNFPDIGSVATHDGLVLAAILFCYFPYVSPFTFQIFRGKLF